MKILLVEDDVALSEIIQEELEKHGYLVDVCHDGETAMLYALRKELAYDLAILDRMLPIIDGLTILKAMRRKHIHIPVILITGMSAIDERIEGLDSGADDYLVKPFHMKELLARVRACSRRPTALQKEACFKYADLTLDSEAHTLKKGDKQVLLTGKETQLMEVFIRKPDTVFGKEMLILKIWGTSSTVEPGNVDNYISFLRKRLRTLKSICEIKTIYGVGYKLEKTVC